MFGIGLPELVIILIVALLVVGPSKLPEVARSVGKALGQFRRMADDVKDTLEREMDREDEKKEEPKGGEKTPEEPKSPSGETVEGTPATEERKQETSHDEPSDANTAKIA